MKPEQTRVAVTGATGFVGSHIVDALLHAGATVRAVVRNPGKASRLRELGVEIAQADITDPPALRAAFVDCDAIVSNAALGSWAGEPEDYVRINEIGATNVLRAATDNGIDRAIVISTVAVYSTRLFTPMTESTARYPTDKRRFNWSDLTTDWRYSRSKTQGEALARAHAAATGMAITFLRPSPVYGGRDPKLTRRLIERLEHRIRFEPTVGVPFVHARDVGDAVVGALRNDASAGKGYNLAGPALSPYTLMRALKTISGRGPLLIPVPLPVWVQFDTTAARTDLGFTPRPIADGLAESLANVA
ncbi:MAG: nucleoside-diphosphate-sugar epimerase [Kiritimatiellia bacterium]|jgi:nucleoside-diphosphate-sugar epimerase